MSSAVFRTVQFIQKTKFPQIIWLNENQSTTYKLSLDNKKYVQKLNKLYLK